MKLNFIVKVVIRKDKIRKDGTCPLYLKVTKNGKQLVKLSMGENVINEHWDSREQKAIGKGYGLFNKHIKRSVLEVEDLIGDLKSRGKVPTKEDIVSCFKKEDKQCYFKYFDEIFCKHKFPTLAEATKESYELLRKRLKEFKPNLRLADIDLKLIQDFNYFLRNDKQTGKGGIWNRNKNFRTVLKFAYDLDLIESYPYKNFKLEKPKAKNEALTLEELNRFADLDLSLNERLEVIRDKFIFACYTGLRFGDVNSLKWENIKNGVLRIVQEKTKNPVQIPLNKQAKRIIAKNIKFKKERNTVFKMISNQKTNYILKDIAELAEVDKNVSFHLARHTFGTILGRDQNAFTIMKLMGHKKISTSAIYVNTNVEELKNTMQAVSFG